MPSEFIEIPPHREEAPPPGLRSGLIVLLALALSRGLYFCLPFDVTARKGLFLLVFIGVLWLTEALHLAVTALLVPMGALLPGIPACEVASRHSKRAATRCARLSPSQTDAVKGLRIRRASAILARMRFYFLFADITWPPVCCRLSTGLSLHARMTVLSRLVLLAGLCWVMPLRSQEMATAKPVDSGQGLTISTTRLASIDGRHVEYWASRVPQAKANLVFESGLMLPLTTWQAVASELAGSCNMLAYNRPGVGRSELPDQPQGADVAAGDLLKLLQSQGLEPPYILVGHSLGGQHAQRFASQYPELVSGMVLVDALPVGVVKPAAQFPWFTRLGLWLLAPEYVRREIGNIHPMGESLLSGSRLQGKPIVRLVAQSATPKPEGLIKDLLRGVILAEDFGVWAVDPDEAEARMNTLYPQSIVKPVQAHHRVQEVAADVVIDAIRQVMQ